MACCTAPEERYVDMELASHNKANTNEATDILPNARAQAAAPRRGAWAALSVASVLLLISLALSIYAAAVARKPVSAVGPGGAILTTSPRNGPGGATYGGHLFAGSGYYAPMRPMMYSRSDFRAVPIGNYIYLIGGLTNDLPAPGANSSANTGRVINNVVRYDTYNNVVSEMAPMPEPRSRFAVAVSDGVIYVIGGITNNDNPDVHDPSGTVLKYDTAANKWSRLPGGAITPRSDSCGAALGGKVYLMGGWAANYSSMLGGEVLDLSTGKWSPLPDGMIKRGDCEAAALDDCVLVVGGWGPEDFSNVTECYSPSKGAWSRRADMHKARGDFAAEVLPGNRVLVLGGETGGAAPGSNEHAQHHVEEYNADDDVWIIRAPLPEARFRFDAAHVDNRVYIYGGHPTCSSTPKDPSAVGRDLCVKVALNSSWAFIDVPHPDVYVWYKDGKELEP